MEAVMKSLEAEEETHQNKESSREKESNAAAASTTEQTYPETGFASGPTVLINAPSSSEASDDTIDLSARTKATVTVVGRSSTSGNVLDGLLRRRWDLNFFKK